MCRILFSFIVVILFFQKGLISMENSNFFENALKNHRRDCSQEMEGCLKRKIIIYLAGQNSKWR